MWVKTWLKINFCLGIAGFLLSACQEKYKALPYYNSPDFTPQLITDKAIARQKITHTIAGFSLSNQQGKKFTHQELEGKIHIANFIFTSCGSICPKMTSNLKEVQKAFYDHPEVMLLSYSVTPWIDTEARLLNYAAENQITASNWQLLRGRTEEIYTLARKSYFAEEDLGFTKDSTDFLHTEHILLVDKSRRIRGIYNGTLSLEIHQLVSDMQHLLKEED